MQNHYILIDYENTRIQSVEQLLGEKTKICIFVGANQTKIPIELAASLQKLGGQVQYVKIAGVGKNALDFHIAFYLGLLSQRDSKAVFHLISKDQGFQPLLSHLNQLGIETTLSDSWEEVVHRCQGSCQSIQDKASSYLDQLHSTKMTKPRTVKSLSNSIRSYFKGEVTMEEIDAIIQRLVQAKGIRVDSQRITYPTRKAAGSKKKSPSTTTGEP